MYTAIYRDFRPDSFDGLVGQDHIVKILKNQIATGRTGHAYLFCGTRGTGKTTTARILAKALNCEGEGEKPCGQCENCQSIKAGTFMDVIEIDAASNNGVENIRELRESVKYPPVRGKNKVYIIDEVHMLSQGAFNALLKTLEEPPEHVVFILATTEPQKLPATILSRCMRLDFRRVSEAKIIENMKMICKAKGITAEDSALSLIAVNADGSVRDSLSILEQCLSTAESTITRDDVAELLGTAGEETMIELTEKVMAADISGALLLLDAAINSGRDVKQFMKEWLEHFRNLLMAKYIDSPENVLNMSLENVDRVKAQAASITTELLNRGITELTKTISEAKWSSQPRVLLEMCIVRLGMGREVEKVTVFKNDGMSTAAARGAASAPYTGRGYAPAQAARDPQAGRPLAQAAAMPDAPGAAPSLTQSATSGADATYAPAAPAALSTGTPAPYAAAQTSGTLSDFTQSATSGADATYAPAAPAALSTGMPAPYAPSQTSAPEAARQADIQAVAGDLAQAGTPHPQAAPAGFAPSGAAPDALTQALAASPELASIWKTVVQKAVGEKPMLVRIETKTALARIDDKNFYVSTADSMAEKMLLGSGKAVLEDKMEMYYGKRLNLCLEKSGTAVASPADDGSAEDIAKRLNERFGVEVEIK